MKKGIKFSLYILGIGIGLAVIEMGLVLILKYCGLMFREWVRITFFVIMSLLGFALLGGIFYTLVKVFSLPQGQKRKKITQKILSASGIVIALLGTAMLGIFVLFGGAFLYKPEHVIDKYGQKMVAYVDGFLDVDVKYHEYKNFLVCGYDVIGNEWYGSGGYDPFIRDPIPEPKTYKFYDIQGNLITESETKIMSQDNSDISGIYKELEVSVFPPKKMKCNFDNSDAKAFCEMSYSVDGENWEKVNTGYHYQFFFQNTGYLIFSYDWAMQHEAAAIYKSADGGENWTFVSDAPADELLQKTLFFDENTGIFEYGIVGTDSYILFATTDGADTFRKIDLPTELQGQMDKIKNILTKSNKEH